MVDPRRLRTLLHRIAEEAKHLEELGRASDEDLLGDRTRLSAVKYGFVVATEAAIDAGEHVISSEGLRGPDSFGDVFKVLGEAGYIDQGLASRLEGMAGFRNVLVHGYLKVDDHRVLEILRTRLGDLDDFREQIAGKALG